MQDQALRLAGTDLIAKNENILTLLSVLKTKYFPPKNNFA